MDVVTLGLAKADAARKFGTQQQVLQRPRKVLPRPQETALTTFASGHGFAATGAWASSNLNDTGDNGWAAQVVTGTTPGNGSGCWFESSAVAAFDPTGKYILLLAKCSDPTQINSIQVYLGSSTNQTIYNMTGAGRLGSALPNEWTLLVGSVDSSSLVGTGAAAGATVTKIRVSDKTGPGMNIKFGGLSLAPPSSTFPNGVVSLTFDDCWASHYTNVRPLLNARRLRATEFPILDQIGGTGRLTLAQIVELEQLNGWEIGAHASTLAVHAAGYQTLTADQMDAEMRTLRAWQVTNGLRGDSLAYPGGQMGGSTVPVARRYYAQARSTESFPKETMPPADAMRMKSVSVQASDAATVYTALVDGAFTNKHHLIFTIHDVVASGATGSSITAATLTTLVDYCATKGIPVRPLGEVMAAY